jgi:hypothetical protein
MQICAHCSSLFAQEAFFNLGAETDTCVCIDANMLDMLDSGLGNVSSALTASGMWSNTLLVFSAVCFSLAACIEFCGALTLWARTLPQDNGGVGALGNNYPLRGHK